MFGRIILTDIFKLNFLKKFSPLLNKYNKNDFEVSPFPLVRTVITEFIKPFKTASFCVVAAYYSIVMILDACIPGN